MKNPYPFALKICSILSVLGFTSCAMRLPLKPAYTTGDAAEELAARLKNQPEPAVLFIGNSYSFGVPAAFKKLAVARGKSLRIGHSTYGGWSLAKHAVHRPTLQKIAAGNWDIVVLQEQSEIPAQRPWQRNRAMYGPLNALVTAVRHAGAIPVLYQTWGRRDGDPNRRNDSFQAMNQRLRDGYHAAAKNAGGIAVVPVGDAWQREINAGRGEALFVADGSHPSALGNSLTATIFYQFLFPNSGNDQ